MILTDQDVYLEKSGTTGVKTMNIKLSDRAQYIPLFASDVLGEEAEKAKKPSYEENWYDRDSVDEVEEFYEEVENDDHKGTED